MKIFRKVGNAFKWLGSKVLWVVKRNETLLAIRLAQGFVPIPALYLIVELVHKIDKEDRPGAEKMAIALEGLPAILHDFDIEIGEESEARLLIEIAVAIMKKKARIIHE